MKVIGGGGGIVTKSIKVCSILISQHQYSTSDLSCNQSCRLIHAVSFIRYNILL